MKTMKILDIDDLIQTAEKSGTTRQHAAALIYRGRTVGMRPNQPYRHAERQVLKQSETSQEHI